MFVKVASVILSLLCLISGLILIMFGFEKSDGKIPLDIVIPGVILASLGLLIFFVSMIYYNHNSQNQHIDDPPRLENNFNVNDFLYPVYPDGSINYEDDKNNIKPSAPPLY